MKVAILGANGQIGKALSNVLSKKYKIEKITRKKLNYYNLKQVKEFLLNKDHNLIINAAAFKQVDQAEKEKNKATILNAKFPKLLSEIAKIKNIPLIHYSTDYVFSGKSKISYKENSKPNPINFYGKSKLQGDQYLLVSNCKGIILRVGWVYANKGKNFLNTILNISKKNKVLKIVNDQIGTPTNASFIANITKQLIEKKIQNSKITVINVCPNKNTSWYKLTKYLFQKLNNKKVKILKIKTKDYKRIAKVSLFSQLNNKKLQLILKKKLPDWKTGVNLFIKQI
jgi:dTDP-4-dehydrorhamnose reductase